MIVSSSPDIQKTLFSLNLALSPIPEAKTATTTPDEKSQSQFSAPLARRKPSRYFWKLARLVCCMNARRAYRVIPRLWPTFETHLLPPPIKSGLRTIVFDLDGTLVHTTTTPIDSSNFSVVIETNERPLFIFVSIRPGLKKFLDELSHFFELVVFTASEQQYADAILDRVDPKRRIAHRLYRNHCSYSKGVLVKDLSRLGRNLQSVVIVDDIPDSFVWQKENGIKIQSYLGEEEDTALQELLPVLMRLKDVQDVQQAIKKKPEGEHSHKIAFQ